MITNPFLRMLLDFVFIILLTLILLNSAYAQSYCPDLFEGSKFLFIKCYDECFDKLPQIQQAHQECLYKLEKLKKIKMRIKPRLRSGETLEASQGIDSNGIPDGAYDIMRCGGGWCAEVELEKAEDYYEVGGSLSCHFPLSQEEIDQCKASCWEKKKQCESPSVSNYNTTVDTKLCDKQYQDCVQQDLNEAHEDCKRKCQDYIQETEDSFYLTGLGKDIHFNLQEIQGGWQVKAYSPKEIVVAKKCMDKDELRWQDYCNDKKKACLHSNFNETPTGNSNSSNNSTNNSSFAPNSGSIPFASCTSTDIKEAIAEAQQFISRLHGKFQKQAEKYMTVVNMLPNSDLKNILLGIASDISVTVYQIEGELVGFIGDISGKYQALSPVFKEVVEQYDRWGYAFLPLLLEEDQKQVERAVNVMRAIVNGGCG